MHVACSLVLFLLWLCNNPFIHIFKDQFTVTGVIIASHYDVMTLEMFSHYYRFVNGIGWSHSWQQGLWDQHVAHLGPTGPRRASCWPHEFCYLRLDSHHKVPVMPSVDVCFGINLIKLLKRQPSCLWFKTPWRPWHWVLVKQPRIIWVSDHIN